MQILDTAFYFVVTLGILVFIHELGHFLAAKLFGMRVDRFSIGLPPRAFGKKIGETDYCVSWIPFGGYVKIAGMIDESFDTDHLERPPEPWEYRSKPIWQRMIVISAGVIMNLLLAVVIFWGINYAKGRTVWETTEIAYVAAGTPAAQAGLESGDRVLSVNGEPVASWDDLVSAIYLDALSGDVAVRVSRGESTRELLIPRESVPQDQPAQFGIVPAHTAILVSTVQPGMPAAELGLEPGDVLTALGGTPIFYNDSVIEIITAHAGQPLAVQWKRGDQTLDGTVTPTEDGKIGISFHLRYDGPTRTIEYSLLEALPKSVTDIAAASALFVQQIGNIITGRTPFAQSVGGPIRIAQMATQTAEMGIPTYLGFMALLSISLALLNILPIPALDGGHLLLLAIEAVIRREIPVRVKLGIQKVGFILLLAFMVFVVYNDILNF
jgi:regulator of sigma E protease